MGKAKTSALDTIRANIQGEVQSKTIAAWSSDDEDFTVYWNPITLADKQKIQKHARGDDQQTTLYTLIFKAMDKDGENLFTIADKMQLMSVIPSKEIEEIALLMLGVSDEITAGN